MPIVNLIFWEIGVAQGRKKVAGILTFQRSVLRRGACGGWPSEGRYSILAFCIHVFIE
jgi:hypothetical protein